MVPDPVWGQVRGGEWYSEPEAAFEHNSGHQSQSASFLKEIGKVMWLCLVWLNQRGKDSQSPISEALLQFYSPSETKPGMCLC